MMIGRLLSFWDDIFSGAMWNLQGVGFLISSRLTSHDPETQASTIAEAGTKPSTQLSNFRRLPKHLAELPGSKATRPAWIGRGFVLDSHRIHVWYCIVTYINHKSLIFYGIFHVGQKNVRLMQGGARTRGLNGVITPINGIRYNWVCLGLYPFQKGVN